MSPSILERPLCSLPQEPKAVKSCDICLGMHDGADCSEFVGYVNKLEISSSVDDNEYKYEYEPSSPVYSETEDKEEESQAPSAPEVCDLCCREHNIADSCNYYFNVPQYAQVGPFYQIHCRWCDWDIENDLFCPSCRKVVPGCLKRKFCKNCCRYLSSTCCANPETFEPSKLVRATSTAVCLPAAIV